MIKHHAKRHARRHLSVYAAVTVFLLLSLLILAVAGMTQTMRTSSATRAAEYLGPCQEYPPVNAPAGYRWRADCANDCSGARANSCPRSTDRYVQAETSAWCYGFENYTKPRCMMLQYIGTGGGSGNTTSGGNQPPAGGGSRASCTPGAFKGSYCDDFTEKPRRFKVDIYYNDDCSDRYETYNRQKPCDGDSGGNSGNTGNNNPTPSTGGNTNPTPRSGGSNNPPPNTGGNTNPTPSNTGNNNPTPSTGGNDTGAGTNTSCSRISVTVNRDGKAVPQVNVAVTQSGSTRRGQTGSDGKVIVTLSEGWKAGNIQIVVTSGSDSESFTRQISGPTQCSATVTLASRGGNEGGTGSSGPPAKQCRILATATDNASSAKIDIQKVNIAFQQQGRGGDVMQDADTIVGNAKRSTLLYDEGSTVRVQASSAGYQRFDSTFTPQYSFDDVTGRICNFDIRMLRENNGNNSGQQQQCGNGTVSREFCDSNCAKDTHSCENQGNGCFKCVPKATGGGGTGSTNTSSCNSLTIRVKNGSDAVEGARLVVTQGSLVAYGTTDVSGSKTWEGSRPAGSIRIKAAKDGLTVEENVVIAGPGTCTAEIDMKAPPPPSSVGFKVQNNFTPFTLEWMCIADRTGFLCHGSTQYRASNINRRLEVGDSYTDSRIVKNFCSAPENRHTTRNVLVNVSFPWSNQYTYKFSVDCSKKWPLYVGNITKDTR
ncbi:MAG: hypothetical protein N2691_02820 [Patescibacteria group bacterium]|nr:hypothetical protein [Patescibacteria group bacterium]